MWKKIAGPALLVGILWIGGGGATTYYVMRLQSSMAKVLRENMAVVRLAGDLETTLWQVHSAVREANSYGQPNLSVGGSRAELQFERILESVRRVVRTDAETQVIGRIGSSFSEYRQAAHQTFARSEPKGSGSPNPATDDTAHLAAVIAGYCEDFAALERRLLSEEIDRYSQLLRGVNALRLILFCSGPLIGVLVGVGIMRNLRSTTHRFSVRLEEGAGENELVQVDTAAGSELHAIQKQVTEVPSRLNQVAGQLDHKRRDSDRGQTPLGPGDLAAGIAHELRNPLTSLKLLIQAAARKQRDRPLSDKQYQILQDEINRMEGSIQSLLDFTRPRQIRRRVHNVCDTLRRSLNLVRTRASQNGVSILEGLPGERIMVDGDPEQLHQVFVNLLLNAMEAMPDGGTLRVAMGGIAEDDSMCRIKCSDSGRGIAPDILDRIFEPFVSGKEHGHGLGLAVSRRIVGEHGGSLSVANRPEGGTVFTIALPFVSIDRDTKPPGSDPDLAAQRPPSDPDLAVHAALNGVDRRV